MFGGDNSFYSPTVRSAAESDDGDNAGDGRNHVKIVVTGEFVLLPGDDEHRRICQETAMLVSVSTLSLSDLVSRIR